MTITVNRTISVKDIEGKLIKVDGNQSLITKSEVTLTCDGPRCGQRHGKKSPVTTSFIEEELQANPDSSSATFRKFGQFKFNLAVKEFCSLECAEDVLRATKDIPEPPPLTVEQLVQKTNDGSPSSEDLDSAVKNEIPGVTAAVEV